MSAGSSSEEVSVESVIWEDFRIRKNISAQEHAVTWSLCSWRRGTARKAVGGRVFLTQDSVCFTSSEGKEGRRPDEVIISYESIENLRKEGLGQEHRPSILLETRRVEHTFGDLQDPNSFYYVLRHLWLFREHGPLAHLRRRTVLPITQRPSSPRGKVGRLQTPAVSHGAADPGEKREWGSVPLRREPSKADTEDSVVERRFAAGGPRGSASEVRSRVLGNRPGSSTPAGILPVPLVEVPDSGGQRLSMMQSRTLQVAQRAEESALRSMRSAAAAEQLGTEALRELELQGEQLEGAQREMDEIDHNLKVGGKLLRGIKSIWGAVRNVFSKKITREESESSSSLEARGGILDVPEEDERYLALVESATSRGTHYVPCVVDVRGGYIFLMDESMSRCLMDILVETVERVVITDTPLHVAFSLSNGTVVVLMSAQYRNILQKMVNFHPERFIPMTYQGDSPPLWEGARPSLPSNSSGRVPPSHKGKGSKKQSSSQESVEDTIVMADAPDRYFRQELEASNARVSQSIDHLGSVVSNLRHLGLEMGARLDSQAVVLDRLDESVSRSSTQIRGYNRDMKEILRK